MAPMPEQPLLIYPSHVQAYGLEGALLLQCYQQLLELLIVEPDQPVAIVISRQQWLRLVPFWDEEQLAMATGELVARQAIDVGFLGDDQVQISRPWHEHLTETAPEASAAEPLYEDAPGNAAMPPSMSSTPSVPGLAAHEPYQNGHQVAEGVMPETASPAPAIEPATVGGPRVMRRRINSETLMQQRGPAPVFGGSTGWRKAEAEEAEDKDELHQVFHMREEHNQKLHSMFVGWKPSQTFFELLPRHSIPTEYAEECLDEFTLYWLDKDRKESNWDQKFLAWVKREWIRKQTREARQRNQDSNEPTTGVSGHENTRRDTRENRKRVTAAIMDVRDTDW